MADTKTTRAEPRVFTTGEIADLRQLKRAWRGRVEIDWWRVAADDDTPRHHVATFTPRGAERPYVMRAEGASFVVTDADCRTGLGHAADIEGAMDLMRAAPPYYPPLPEGYRLAAD